MSCDQAMNIVLLTLTSLPQDRSSASCIFMGSEKTKKRECLTLEPTTTRSSSGVRRISVSPCSERRSRGAQHMHPGKRMLTIPTFTHKPVHRVASRAHKQQPNATRMMSSMRGQLLGLMVLAIYHNQTAPPMSTKEPPLNGCSTLLGRVLVLLSFKTDPVMISQGHHRR